MIEVETVIEAEGWEAAGLEALAARAAQATAAHLGLARPVEIAVLGCDDARIAGLNQGFRGRPVPTNVLSFPSSGRAAARDGAHPPPPDGADPELGDIAIAFETCLREARSAGIPLSDHATHLLVHGVLHLMGYDHERPADGDLMERMEGEILATLGLPDPYSRNGD